MDWNVIIPALTGLIGTAIGAYLAHLARMREERRKDMLFVTEQKRIDENQQATLYEISDDTIRNRFAWLESRLKNYETTIDEQEREKAMLTEELRKTRQALDDARIELARTRRERDEATQARQDRLEYIKQLEKDLEHANAKIERLTAEADEMRERILKLEKRDTGPLKSNGGT